MQQNRTRMPGPLLCSGRLGDFRPLGALGRTVVSAAPQLRTGVRRRIDAQAAEMLAIPQVNETGETVDWYAPIPGPVVPWSAGTEDERRAGAVAAKEFREHLLAQSRTLIAGNPRGDDEVFARLLPLTPMIPAESFIYLVDGKPVLTYWGFHPLDGPQDLDVIRDLPLDTAAPGPAAPAPMAPAAVPVAIAPHRPWWRWLAWLLGLLLALLLLLLLLRGCGLVPWSMPDVAIPHFGIMEPDAPRREGATPAVPAVPAIVPPRGDTLLPEPVDAVPITPGVTPGGTAAGAATMEAEVPALPTTVPAPDAPTADADGNGQAPPVDPESPPESPDATPPAPELPAETAPPAIGEPAAGEPPGQGLSIPEDARADGTVDFLDGRWRSRTSLMDSRTGRPLDVEYEFSDGEGTSTITRSDGVACRAPVQARMTDGTLELVQTGPAACPDGTAFDASRVECTPDQDGRAQCRGIHETGEGFLVDIVQ